MLNFGVIQKISVILSLIDPYRFSMHVLLEKVEQALQNIRPYLEADGGDVKVVDISPENVVKVEFMGSCSSCPMSAMTFKAGVEEAIKKAVPEVSAVEAINLSPYTM